MPKKCGYMVACSNKKCTNTERCNKPLSKSSKEYCEEHQHSHKMLTRSSSRLRGKGGIQVKTHYDNRIDNVNNWLVPYVGPDENGVFTTDWLGAQTKFGKP